MEKKGISMMMVSIILSIFVHKYHALTFFSAK